MRKSLISLISLIGLFLIISVTLVAQERLQTDVIELGWISSIKGEVFFQDGIAEINMAVLEKDTLTTRKGRVEVDLGQGNYVWLDKNTIVAFIAPQEESVLLTILQGSICLRVGSKVIEIKTLSQEPFRPEIGFYQVDIEDDELEIDRDPRPSDPFISWSYKRKNELDRLAIPAKQRYSSEETDYGYYGSNYNYYGGYWGYFSYLYSPWSWYPYWGWGLYYPYYAYGYGYYGYGSGSGYYGGNYGGYGQNHYRTVIHKNQLKRNVSNNFTTATTTKRVSRTIRKTYPSSSRIRSSSTRSSSRSISSRSSISRVPSRAPSKSVGSSRSAQSSRSSGRSSGSSKRVKVIKK